MMYERRSPRSIMDHHHGSPNKLMNERQHMGLDGRIKNHNDHSFNHYFGNINKDVGRLGSIDHEDQRLEIIDLSAMSLDYIPNLSVNLAAICKLVLSNNNIEIIPESLTARLLNVVVLDVHSNQITTLPNSIGCMSKLKILNVAGNLLTSIPKTIENCRSLEELNANFNKLTMLPDTMGFELPNLKKLCVNSNKLVLLPYSISHATSLRILDVRLNCLRSLPDDLENLINLEILNVSQNFQYLVELPSSLGLLMSLVELDVSYNKLTTLPTSLGCLRKLQKLSVEGNPLVSPPMEVVERGLQAVREYMSEKINGYHNDSSKKKSWFKNLKKHKGNGRAHRTHREESRGLVLPEYRPLEAIASPRYKFGIFSPKRFFTSPHDTITRLG